MKKIVCIILCFVFIVGSLLLTAFYQTKTTSASSISGYGQIIYNNVYLFRYPSDSEDFSNKHCLIEPTYFVKVLEKQNELFYKVEYLGLTGYVKIEEVELISETPINPYPENITFDIVSNTNAILRSEPTTANKNKSIISVLNANTKNLIYLGKISGEESLMGCGNVWYYCMYKTANDSVKFGYVYSSLTTNLSPITENMESVTAVSLNSKSFIDFLYINLSTQNLIIAIMFLPSLLIIYLFVKPTRIYKKNV